MNRGLSTTVTSDCNFYIHSHLLYAQYNIIKLNIFLHVHACTATYACASVHLGSLESMGIRVCGWGCLVHVIGAHIRKYMHSICNTLSIKSGKKHVLSSLCMVCRTKRSCMCVV